MSEQNAISPRGEPHELPIGQILAILWRGRWIISVSVLIAVGLGLGFVIRRGTIWRATSRLQVESTAPGGTTVESLLLAAGGKNYVNTQAEVLRSGSVLGPVLKNDEIRNNPLFAEVENPQTWLKKVLEVSVGRKDDIITISLDSKLKEDACQIVNKVVESYMEFYSQQNKTKAGSIVERLGARLQDLERDREQLAKTRAEFLEKNANFSLSGENIVMANRLRELQSAALHAEDGEEQARIAYEEGKTLAKDPERLREILQLRGGVGVSAGQGRLKSEIRKQIWELENRRQVLLAQVTETHPGVQALDTQIRGLKAQIDEIEKNNKDLVNGYVSSLLAAWKSNQELLGSSRRKLALAKAQFHELEMKRLEFDKLEDEWATNSKLVAALTETVGRFTLADLKDSNSNPLNINILDLALPRTATVASSRAMTLAIFLVLGLMAGFGLAWLRGIFDQRLRNAEDVTVGVQIALLGTLPRVSIAQAEDGDALAVWEHHESLAEAARSLRTAVYFGLPKGEGRCIQISSPESGDGKSMIASNLAIAMAQAGQRTLIVDADLRRPRQAALFGLDQEPGLATVLASGQRVEELIQKTSLDELDVLTSGPIPANPAEILNSEAFGELLEQLGRLYDRVIVDSPPVLPVADARIIATRCDVTVLVLRVDKSTRKRAIGAYESLQTVSARVLGAVLNDMPEGIGYGYGGYYGGRYGYGGYKRRISPSPSEAAVASIKTF